MGSASVSIDGGSELGSSLMDVLMCDAIVPGSEPSYQVCKEIYLSHPLGGKMAESPITLAQSQEREITIQDAPDEVKAAFLDEWAALEADTHILNVHALARVYGISALVFGVRGFPADKPVDMEKLYQQDIFFNGLDPLNTAGSLVLSQNTNDPNFQRPVRVTTSGDTYHPSRFRVVMNERPVFIAYTNSGFGFVGRSVYQRALFPLKSFIRSMMADDMILTKLGVLIAKQKATGAVVNQPMQQVSVVKRLLLKLAQTFSVLTIGVDEEIETLNMQNVDGAGTYARTNCIRNIETAADMPAKMLEQETMVSGFGEGTEDTKRTAQYIGRIRIKMLPEYRWFENIVQYRAWNPEWYKRVIQAKYDQYAGVDFKVAFSEWRQAFHAQWPSWLIEPESEEIKKEEVKLEAVVAILNVLLTQLDPDNRAKLIQWAADCFGENKRLFPHELELDWDALTEFQEQNQEQKEESHDASINPEGKKFPSFGDSSAVVAQIDKLRAAVSRLTKPKLVEAKA